MGNKYLSPSVHSGLFASLLSHPSVTSFRIIKQFNPIKCRQPLPREGCFISPSASPGRILLVWRGRRMELGPIYFHWRLPWFSQALRDRVGGEEEEVRRFPPSGKKKMVQEARRVVEGWRGERELSVFGEIGNEKYVHMYFVRSSGIERWEVKKKFQPK